MPDKKISELTKKTTLINNDEFPFVRLKNKSYINYKVKRSNILANVSNVTKKYVGQGNIFCKVVGRSGVVEDTALTGDYILVS